MIRILLAVAAGLSVALILALWRIDHVTNDRDAALVAVTERDAQVASLRVTMRLSRELMTEQESIVSTYLEEKRLAEEEAERLRRCLADGTCRLRVNATCVRAGVDGAGSAAGQPDAGTPELTAAARRAYPALVAGLRAQRAQITGLQAELIALHSRCKIGASQ